MQTGPGIPGKSLNFIYLFSHLKGPCICQNLCIDSWKVLKKKHQMPNLFIISDFLSFKVKHTKSYNIGIESFTPSRVEVGWPNVLMWAKRIILISLIHSCHG